LLIAKLYKKKSNYAYWKVNNLPNTKPTIAYTDPPAAKDINEITLEADYLSV